jgi:hypothetical protein
VYKQALTSTNVYDTPRLWRCRPVRMTCSPDERDLISREGRESCDSERVGQLLHKIRAANGGKRRLVILDNAPSNHADPVSEAAKRLPSSAPVATG